MSNIKKGKVYEINGNKVRAQDLDNKKSVSPLLDVGEFEVSTGNLIAYVVFKDGTGIVLALMKE